MFRTSGRMEKAFRDVYRLISFSLFEVRSHETLGGCRARSSNGENRTNFVGYNELMRHNESAR
jgi:hypothetical protein